MQLIDILNDTPKSDLVIRVLYHCAECFYQALMMKLGTQNGYTDIVLFAYTPII
ncbi:hypothetical protein JCM10512_1278 [Bacteroides reticulotermitis JCM 10512]|uniref:Uncharacterized protein n=1 Tax=Bacteroides reticulotermitis JCM 10512 TaxID=1445607 RepID=W4UQY6_9BACE|nr:hypothetical protein JCM10512_1278 [Bacteroides reticulotermitis JCM 10512]